MSEDRTHRGMLTTGQALPGRQTLGQGNRLAVLAGMLILASALYLLLIPWHSLDADHWFVPWLDHIVQHGPIDSLRHPMQVDTEGANGSANYNPPYLYLLILGSYASRLFGDLTIVKLVAIAGSAMCAGCVFCRVRTFASQQRAVFSAAGF